MDKETVHVYPDDKDVIAYRYASTILLVVSKTVRDTDESILTDSAGFRYKRYIRKGDSEWDIHYEYRRI